MRVAVVSDTHRNLDTLEAVLVSCDTNDLDEIVCQGMSSATAPTRPSVWRLSSHARH